MGQVQPDAPATARPHPARALAGPAADLEDVAAGHVAEDREVVLAVALGSPDEAGIAEEGAVGGLVLVGVAVPVGTVGGRDSRSETAVARPARTAAGGPPRPRA